MTVYVNQPARLVWNVIPDVGEFISYVHMIFGNPEKKILYTYRATSPSPNMIIHPESKRFGDRITWMLNRTHVMLLIDKVKYSDADIFFLSVIFGKNNPRLKVTHAVKSILLHVQGLL